MSTERCAEYDILKAIGILSVVAGHCMPFPAAVRLVYSFHLAIFFFVAGAQYNSKKYALQPFLFMQNRGRALWKPYFFYSLLFALTHNVAVRYGMLENGQPYTLQRMVFAIWDGAVFNSNELLGGALWFVPMMFFGAAAFAGCMWMAHRLPKKAVLLGALVFSVLVGWTGIVANISGTHLLFHTQSSLVLLPVMTVGWLSARGGMRPARLFRWFAALPCAVLWVWLVLIKGYTIELSQEKIAGGWMFYLVSLCGIYVMGWAATLLARCKLVSRGLCWIGRYSFDIMALHFAVFKVLDVIFGRLNGASAVEFAKFPVAYPKKLWPLYLLFGMLLPLLFRVGLMQALTLVKHLCTIRKKAKVGAN